MLDVHRIVASISKAAPIGVHLLLVLAVAAYTLMGAVVMQSLEKGSSTGIKHNGRAPRATNFPLSRLTDEQTRHCVRVALLAHVDRSKEACGNADDLVHFDLNRCYAATERRIEQGIIALPRIVEHNGWTLSEAVIFAFSFITTIGYGQISPTTTGGRAFCIIYGLFGIPIVLLTVANIGLFMSKGLRHLVLYAAKKFSRRKSIDVESTSEDETIFDRHNWAEPLLLLLAFLLFVLVGSLVLSQYEPEMDVFKAFYFLTISLSTIGLGDVVPKSESHLPLTLAILTLGLALTTSAVEIASDALRKLHYFGRPTIENAAQQTIWFGGTKMQLGRMVKHLADQLNVPEKELQELDVNNFVEQAVLHETGERGSLRRRRRQAGRFGRRALSFSQLELPFIDEEQERGLMVLPPPVPEKGPPQSDDDDDDGCMEEEDNTATCMIDDDSSSNSPLIQFKQF